MTNADVKRAEGANKVLLGVRRTLRFLVLATVILYLALGGIALYSYSTSKLNHDAVCNLTSDLERRIQTSRDFTRDHPEAIRKLGFTKAQVERETVNQERTLTALSVVNC